VNKIHTQLDITKEERVYILEKLQAMCQDIFKNEEPEELSPHKTKSVNSNSSQKLVPKIKQFGSLVTGLALESSDMDMAVTNLFLPDREKMIENLDLFADNLRKWEMIQDLNAISTASIPVIKATVDLN
jgi:poly(A) polymerase Pap1